VDGLGEIIAESGRFQEDLYGRLQTQRPRSRLHTAQASFDSGINITEAYPESVGMGVGFSVLVDAEYDKVKGSLEKQVGKTISACGKEGDSRSCEHKIGEKKTLVLFESGRGKNAKTLFGCYYFYAK
jgi:hypothetical protein